MLAILFTAGMLVLIVAVVAGGGYLDWRSATLVPILNVPVPVILWSCSGSLGAMLYRFYTSADAELADPLRWSFTRPLTGILMGITAYMAFKAGVLLIQPQSGSNTSAIDNLSEVQQQLLWLAAFLAGFSDRFADSVLRKLTGRMGGDQQADFLIAERPITAPKFTMTAIAELLKRGSAAEAPKTPNDEEKQQTKPSATKKPVVPAAQKRRAAPPTQPKDQTPPSAVTPFPDLKAKEPEVPGA